MDNVICLIQELILGECIRWNIFATHQWDLWPHRISQWPSSYLNMKVRVLQNMGIRIFFQFIFKVGQPLITNLWIMWRAKWVRSKCTQKNCTKLLPLPDYAKKNQVPKVHMWSFHLLVCWCAQTVGGVLKRAQTSWGNFNSSLQGKTQS